MKYLVCVAPNSGITFVSKAFTGRISDKKLTLKSGFLDMLPKHCSIMADKGFNLNDECAARSLYFIVPPGRRGTTQMAPADVSKTSNIAKVSAPIGVGFLSGAGLCIVSIRSRAHFYGVGNSE